MPIEAPTGPWTNVEDDYVTALSNSAAFQTLCGVGTAEAALAFIFADDFTRAADDSTFLAANGDAYTTAELEGKPAKALVTSTDGNGYAKVRSAGRTFLPEGQVVLYVERYVSVDWANTMKSMRYFKNRIGELIDQIIVWTFNNLGVQDQRYDVVEGPFQTDTDNVDAQYAMQAVTIAATWKAPDSVRQ